VPGLIEPKGGHICVTQNFAACATVQTYAHARDFRNGITVRTELQEFVAGMLAVIHQGPARPLENGAGRRRVAWTVKLNIETSESE
jgi:hypothetical protein